MGIGEKIKSLRKQAGLTQMQLSKKAGIKQPTLSAIEKGDAKNLRATTVAGIAKALNISESLLDSNITYGFGNDNITTPSTSAIKGVPVIDIVQAGDWTETNDPYATGTGVETLPCPYPHGINTFAVTVRGESMSPEFPEGLIIFIDPSQMPENGQYCVAKLSETNEATFKQYIVEDGKAYLKAVNPDWPSPYIPINGSCHIVGRMIGVYKKY